MPKRKSKPVEHIKVEIMVYRRKGKWIFEVDDNDLLSIKYGEAKEKPRSRRRV